ncbi:acetyltransferase [Capsulimonas corticalis]|uniref:Acetyltransferase n=1 Tax=Capsulimonas corticalis TaxID=2219043 RepID=A0A402CSM5_9BACT|nr:GNAT family N-acetyltransferase [Capsulimonas corticalis]BDI31032.1 acetyltransferase [Capsulimonas corticalis]
MTDLFIALAETEEDRVACFAIRREVFVVEQNVPAELEWDEHDAEALHILARDAHSHAPLGTARLVHYKPGIVKIGRVCVLAAARGRGVGASIMEFAWGESLRRGYTEAQLSAQVAVLDFYERLGYESFGEEFMDAGILHRMMRKSPIPPPR